MAAGDLILDANGDVVLNDDEDAFLSDGAGDDCYCQSCRPCGTDNPLGQSTWCEDGAPCRTPRNVALATSSGVNPAGGLYDAGADRSVWFTGSLASLVWTFVDVNTLWFFDHTDFDPDTTPTSGPTPFQVVVRDGPTNAGTILWQSNEMFVSYDRQSPGKWRVVASVAKRDGAYLSGYVPVLELELETATCCAVAALVPVGTADPLVSVAVLAPTNPGNGFPTLTGGSFSWSGTVTLIPCPPV